MGFNWETVLQIVILILALRALHMVSAADSCAEVRRNFVTNEIGPRKLVPYTAFAAKDLRICPNTGYTCCNRQMESRFQTATKKEIENYLKYKTSTLTYNFRSFAEKFQDDVVETFSLSRNLTKSMVQEKLVKKISSKSLRASISAVDRLFRSLGLRSTSDDIKKAFDKFAVKFFQILLEDKNNSTKQDPKYEKCVAKQRTELHPFMDVPTVSAANLSTALQLARTLHQALAAGAEVVNITSTLALSKSCQKSLVRMRFCSHCFGLTLIRPCHGLCKNIIRGCFAGISEFDQYWNYYVTSLVEITQRMGSKESKYNVEIALEDFQNKLSSSLSIVLENITTLRETVEKHCRKTRALKRSRRSTDRRAFPNPDAILDEEDEGEKLDLKAINEKNIGKRRHRGGGRRRFEEYKVQEFLKLQSESLPSSAGSAAADAPARPQVRPPHEVLSHQGQRLRPRKAEKTPVVEKKKSQMHNRIQRFIDSLNRSIDFYRHLPDDLCSKTSQLSIDVANHEKCWDGMKIVESYVKDVASIGFEEQAKNPEVQVLMVEEKVIQAIEKLRKSTLTVFVASDKEDVPGIVLQAPVFEPRKADIASPGFKKDYDFPCDDEDGCQDFGSGSDIGRGEKTDEKVIEIVPGNSDVTNNTVIIEIESPENDDVDTEITFDVKEKDDNKSKGKNKNNHHRKNENRKKGRGTQTKSRNAVTTTTPGNSATKSTNFYSLSWLLCVVLPVLRLFSN